LGLAARGEDSPINAHSSAHPVRLAGQDLGDHRHVCALVDRPEEAYDLLTPLIVDGFASGDRAVHIVDPAAVEDHLARLRDSGIDVSATTASRQLEVATWTDSYLRGGHFDRNRQYAFVREKLREGRQLGYGLTRLIASLDWAADDPAVASDLVAYEARVDDLLRRLPDVVVCTYDLNRHSSRVIADVLGAHPVAVVGGILRINRAPVRATARDRLLEAAARLFSQAGIQASGVDAIIDAAGVAKATFYRHFPSKDDLVVAWLRDPRTRWFDRVRAQAEGSHAEPTEKLLLFFEGVAEWLESEGFRGCAYLNTAVEISDADHPARRIVRDYLDEIQAWLHDVLDDGGYREADMLAKELHALVAGAISLAVARRTSAFAISAREAAARLLANSPHEAKP